MSLLVAHFKLKNIRHVSRQAWHAAHLAEGRLALAVPALPALLVTGAQRAVGDVRLDALLRPEDVRKRLRRGVRHGLGGEAALSGAVTAGGGGG